jgi:hypothetical protein
MIIVRLMGGLGNQLFQYACGRALALRTGHELVLDPSLLDTRSPTAPRCFNLGAFNIAARLSTPEDTLEKPSWLDRVRRRLGLRVTAALNTLHEQGLRFNPGIFPAQFDRLCLVGYWQTEKYFHDCTDTIRRDLTPRAAPDPALCAQIDAVNSVSLHIRRGDYVADAKINSVHGTCALDYYRRAATHIASQTCAPEYFVFTDDPGWARENLKLALPLHFVSDGKRANVEELVLMSRCRHHITANSSFSWWGAWLNPRHDKLVCAPRVWFHDPALDASDLVPDTWTRL